MDIMIVKLLKIIGTWFLERLKDMEPMAESTQRWMDGERY